jgi:hypothetical protein
MQELIQRCSFENWYPIFRQDTIRSKVIDLPADVQEYLLDGEFIVTDDMLPEFQSAVAEGISELGGRVFPKLNFTSPTDATWMGTNRQLKVTCFRDLIFILKASTRILLDIVRPFGVPGSLGRRILVLKRWFDYLPDREFRVFFKMPEIYCTTSRYCDIPCRLDADDVDNLLDAFIDRVIPLFPFAEVILDLYISPKRRVHVVDIAPWNDAASYGMFSAQEIREMTRCETRLCNEVRIEPLEDPAVPLEMQGGTTLREILDSLKAFDDAKNADTE